MDRKTLESAAAAANMNRRRRRRSLGRTWRTRREPSTAVWEREVFFEQRHVLGRQGAFDFTHATELGVTIAGVLYPSRRPGATLIRAMVLRPDRASRHQPSHANARVVLEPCGSVGPCAWCARWGRGRENGVRSSSSLLARRATAARGRARVVRRGNADVSPIGSGRRTHGAIPCTSRCGRVAGFRRCAARACGRCSCSCWRKRHAPISRSRITPSSTITST